MSNSRFGAVPAGHIGISAQFVNADGTIGKIVMEPQPAAAPSSTTPLFYGGASLYDLIGNSTDSANKDVQLYRGDVLTTVGGGTGTVSTTSSTVTRASGSFITDGWRVGRQFMLFAAANDAPQAVEGILCTITAVTATTLTVSGTPLSALTVNTNARIVALAPLYAATIAAGAGNAGATAEAWILSSSNSAAARVKDEKFSATQVLVAAMKTAVTASTVVSLSGDAARY